MNNASSGLWRVLYSWSLKSIIDISLLWIIFNRIVNFCDSLYYKIKRIGVLRDTARTTTTSQPNNRAPNEPAMDKNCPKMTKNAYFGQNLAIFGPKIQIFLGVRKSFCTNITENHQDNLSALFFGQAFDQMGQNAHIWPKMPVLGQNWLFFWPKIQFVGGRE